MVEFGLVIGLFLLVIGGLIQFGIIFWTQNAMTQVARDTARYAVTLSASPCDPNARPQITTAANGLAREAMLVGYANGMWNSAPGVATLGPEGVGADWILPPDTATETFDAGDCPPSDNRIAVNVRIRINHVVPIFLPGLQVFAPPCAGNGFCLTTETELRMEPKRR
jgi:hypothetical protein